MRKILQTTYKHFWIFTKIQKNFTNKNQAFYKQKWIFTKIQKIQKKQMYVNVNVNVNVQ